MESSKQYQINKRIVYLAYRKVKANKGSPGIDGIGFEEFERNLKNYLYKLWNRMSSGSCFPKPVMAVEIPKKNGGVRVLGIPTIEDRIAQMTATLYIEPILDPLFHEDSYGYRPNKSALNAVGRAREQCWKYDYVIDIDIKGLFDNIDHELLMKAVRKHVRAPWILFLDLDQIDNAFRLHDEIRLIAAIPVVSDVELHRMGAQPVQHVGVSIQNEGKRQLALVAVKLGRTENAPLDPGKQHGLVFLGKGLVWSYFSVQVYCGSILYPLTLTISSCRKPFSQ